MEEWKEYRLEDLGDVVGGATPSTKDSSNYDGNIAWITPKDLSSQKGRYISRGERTITEKGYNSCSCKMLPEGSILFSSRAPIGYVAIAQNSLCTNQGFKSVVPNPKMVDNMFLYYLLISQKERIEGLGSGTTFNEVSGKVMKEVEVKIPPIEEQKKIASILSSLDDKIECNRKICENLEQQAQALFKSWFVDFEPFQDGNFVESELGMIPESLSLSEIGDIPHRIESGRRPKGGAVLSGVPSIGAENIKGLGFYDYSKTKYIPTDFANTVSRGKVEGYDLLIYKDGGKPGYFIPNYTIFGEGFPYKEMYINEHVFLLDLGKKEYNIFAYFYLQTSYIMNQLNSIGGKAAIPGINTKDVESLPIYNLDNCMIEKFGKLVYPLIKRILVNCKEIQKLTQLRDTLLPKLMSGELQMID